jgi:hypothetical protein
MGTLTIFALLGSKRPRAAEIQHDKQRNNVNRFREMSYGHGGEAISSMSLNQV